jgi:superfamily I DNA and/or RNA helicase
LIYRAKHVVIIGDAKQLRHISTLSDDSHYSLAVQHNIATETYSYIQHSIFDLASRSVGQHPGILLLKEHYRSHSHIISFANQMFYDNQLVIKTVNKRTGLKQIQEPGRGILWLDVPGQTQHPTGGSALNLNEVEAIIELVPAIRFSMEQKGWKKEEGEIGIVTPYITQKQLITERLEAQGLDNIKVGTAHTFQGDEQEILLFSPVLAPGMSEGSLAWLRRTENLLNVAITRARTTLIIVGDFKFCISLPEENPYRQLAQYVQARPNSVFQSQSWRDLPILIQ